MDECSIAINDYQQKELCKKFRNLLNTLMLAFLTQKPVRLLKQLLINAKKLIKTTFT